MTITPRPALALALLHVIAARLEIIRYRLAPIDRDFDTHLLATRKPESLVRAQYVANHPGIRRI